MASDSTSADLKMASDSTADLKRKETEDATAKEESEAKKIKVSAPDAAVVRKQVEYYLSDDNLKYDKFFHEKIAGDKEGWLDMSLILSCNKMKAMRATKEDVATALKAGSKIEMSPDGNSLRRPGNAALPNLEARPSHPKKSTAHAHDGGAVVVFKGIPEEQSWTQIKEKLKEKLPQKVGIWFVSEVNDKNQCFVITSPFEGDIKFFEELELELAGTKLKAEVCFGDALQNALKLCPKHVKEKREKESRKRQKERNRPIIVGSQRFINVAALRSRIKEILNSRSDGEALKTDGSDFKLIKAVLGYHPKGEKKSAGLVGIKVQKSSQGDGSSRCFWMVKEGGAEEDFSAVKCLAAIEANPPYVPKEEPAASTAAASTAAAPAVEKKEEEKKADGHGHGHEGKKEDGHGHGHGHEEKKEDGHGHGHGHDEKGHEHDGHGCCDGHGHGDDKKEDGHGHGHGHEEKKEGGHGHGHEEKKEEHGH